MTVPTDMRAAQVDRPGPIDTIEVGRLPVPDIGDTEALVAVTTTAVNHVDLLVRSGAYRTVLPSPFVIGRDLVGTVVAVGDRVDDFAIGDAVWCNSLGHDGRQGTFAEYAAVPVERLYRLPGEVDPELAVGLLHSGATAHLGLLREGGLATGDRVFIGGAGGAVGSAAVRIAARLGAVVSASASPEDAAWVRSLGAGTVHDYREPALPDRLRAEVPGGFDLYWDTSGHHDFPATLPLMAQGGRIIVAAGMTATVSLPVGDLYTRDVSLRGFAISNASVTDLAEAAGTVNALLVEDGPLPVRIGARLSLAEAARAHRLLDPDEPESVRGKVVVRL